MDFWSPWSNVDGSRGELKRGYDDRKDSPASVGRPHGQYPGEFSHASGTSPLCRFPRLAVASAMAQQRRLSTPNAPESAQQIGPERLTLTRMRTRHQAELGVYLVEPLA